MPKTCLSQSHRLTATYFRDGKWVANCSCAEYMSWTYSTPERAMNAAVDEHYTAIMPPLAQIGVGEVSA